MLRSRLQYVEDKEIEWKKQNPNVHVASYYKTEQEALKWVLALAESFILEERRPTDAPIPVLADECPKCHAAASRPFNGLTRSNPWNCRNCGHQYFHGG